METEIQSGPQSGYARLKSYLHRHEKAIFLTNMVGGFIFDLLTMVRADNFWDNLILISYLTISSAGILLLNAYDAGKFHGLRMQKIILVVPYIIQFTLGGIFSGFIVLYSHSGSFVASWPFLVMLALLLVGNEYLRDHYNRLVFQITIMFIAIFSYLIFAVPILLHHIGMLIFILSGFAGLAVTTFLGYLINLINPNEFRRHRNTLFFLVGAIYCTFNILYFANVIPPIPLALKELTIAHGVAHLGAGKFQISYEEPRWYQFPRDYNPNYHRFGSEPVYAFSSIYTPTDLTTDIIHEWSYKDEVSGDWIVTSNIRYPIFSGRRDGYRGYSVKTAVFPGQWRVTVKTETGQVLGRTKFTIVPVAEAAEVTTLVK